MNNSTTSPERNKGALLQAARKSKLKEKVPLIVHNTLRWAREVNGRIH